MNLRIFEVSPVDRQDYAHTTQVVNRIIDEVAGTIRTNGIQELDHEQRGGMSTYLYVVDCLVATAYNVCRALPGFALSYGEFHARATAKPQPTEADRGAARGVIAEMEHGPAAKPEAQALLSAARSTQDLYWSALRNLEAFLEIEIDGTKDLRETDIDGLLDAFDAHTTQADEDKAAETLAR
jgi:hypothetical protein